MRASNQPWKHTLKISGGSSVADDRALIQAAFEGVQRVESIDHTQYPTLQRAGVDYIAHLCGGAGIFIDMKRRSYNADDPCSNHWQAPNDPDLALEAWSVVPDRIVQKKIRSVKPGYQPRHEGKIGWTLDRTKETHYIFYRWDPRDTDWYCLLPFQLLRTAAERHWALWFADYKPAFQFTPRDNGHGGYYSLWLPVPRSVVVPAVESLMTGKAAIQIEIFGRGNSEPQ